MNEQSPKIDIAEPESSDYSPPALRGFRVPEAYPPSPLMLSRRERFLVIALAIGLSGVLLAARSVRPDPRGLGTHQQFGLPPCTFRVLFHRPCPTCGMTTAWAHMVRGQIVAAMRTNVGGALLAIVAMGAVPWLLISAVRGRWWGWIPNSATIGYPALGIAMITLVVWIIRLAMVELQR